MHIISRKQIRRAQERYPNARNWLEEWLCVASRARWEHLGDVQEFYPATDQVDCCLVFNACGNNYRLICRVTYTDRHQRGTLFFKYFLTHAEYDKNRWKAACK
ncbi:MAG: type II toxin-antitoxin system HigB family toxin [Myxococcales bacterium]|nr:type II toxin-antitoxin system HigB family toxin [Myxococcales bacterium]